MRMVSSFGALKLCELCPVKGTLFSILLCYRVYWAPDRSRLHLSLLGCFTGIGRDSPEIVNLGDHRCTHRYLTFSGMAHPGTVQVYPGFVRKSSGKPGFTRLETTFWPFVVPSDRPPHPGHPGQTHFPGHVRNLARFPHITAQAAFEVRR